MGWHVPASPHLSGQGRVDRLGALLAQWLHCVLYNRPQSHLVNFKENLRVTRGRVPRNLRKAGVVQETGHRAEQDEQAEL